MTGGYLKPHVFFDRFCFDMVSLLGEYLNILSFSDVEYIMRKVYQHSTHFTLSHNSQQPPASVKLLRYDCVESPFSWEHMTEFDAEGIDKLLAKPHTPMEEEDEEDTALK